MKKKQLLLMINALKAKVNELENDLNRVIVSCSKRLSKEDAMKRDYIVRTEGIGKMKDKKLIDDFKKEFPDYNDITNYKFENLHKYYDRLKFYEQQHPYLLMMPSHD